MGPFFACKENTDCYRTDKDPRGGTSGQGPVLISRSVGAGGANMHADVIEIQKALNRVPPSGGGASPSLDVDGLCGPLTTGAIRRFQTVQFPGRPADARVDPGQRTLRRLNDLLAGETPSSLSETASFGGPIIVSAPTGVELAEQSIPEALARVRKSIFRLFAVRAAFVLPAPLAASDAERRAVEWHFKVHKASDPLAQINRVLAIYDRMSQALHMAARQGSPFRLFKPGREDQDAVAYAEPGGFDFALGEPTPTGHNEPGVHIYIHPKRRARSLVIIHELGHYCGGRRGSGLENDHMAHPLPWPRGKAILGPRNYADMAPDQAFRNTYSYQAYAFPEQDFGKVPDKF